MSKHTFLKACSTYNLTVSDSQLHLLEHYVDLLLARNKRLNLISRKDEHNVWTQHILHCTSLLFHRHFPQGSKILDLGTGGGLPGIVLAIFCPHLEFSLLDATRKKIEAVRAIVKELGISNIGTIWGRAEEVGRSPAYFRKFDIVVARAVAPLDKLVLWAEPFILKKTTIQISAEKTIPPRSLVAYKGGDLRREISRAQENLPIQRLEVLDLIPESEKKAVIVQY